MRLIRSDGSRRPTSEESRPDVDGEAEIARRRVRRRSGGFDKASELLEQEGDFNAGVMIRGHLVLISMLALYRLGAAVMES